MSSPKNKKGEKIDYKFDLNSKIGVHNPMKGHINNKINESLSWYGYG